MKQAVDLARRFLALADRDLRAFEKLVPDPEIDDEVIGFHAQQAVEKCLKAVLVRNGVEFRRVHDLELLLELLAESGTGQPPEIAEIQELNPFAVVLRYDFLGEQSLDRSRVPAVLRAVRQWAEEQIG
jgi:HEPN domain-containing protein